MNPASCSRSPSAVGDTSPPGSISADASISRSGGLIRGSSAGADATTILTRSATRLCRTSARADATSKCGGNARYGSTSSDGNGRTRRLASVAESPSSDPRKNRRSAVMTSTSASEGTTTTIKSSTRVAAAMKNAFAAPVSPVTISVSASRPTRSTAALSNALRLNEVEVGIVTSRDRRFARSSESGVPSQSFVA